MNLALEKVRGRLAYARFRKIAEAATGADPVEVLDAVFVTLDAMRAFRSETASAYAGEALEVALEDVLRTRSDIRWAEFEFRRQQREGAYPTDPAARAFLGNAQRTRRLPRRLAGTAQGAKETPADAS